MLKILSKDQLCFVLFGYLSWLFGHLMWRANMLEKTLMLVKIEGRRRRGWQRMRWLDGINDMSLSKLRELVMPSLHILCHWNYEPWHVGPPKMDGLWWRVLTKSGPLAKGMANHFSILALRTPWTIWKGKMIGYLKRNSPGPWVPNMLLEISGEITPERMKGWRQSKNNTQLWMWLVIEARSDAVRAILHRNLECQVHESRQIDSDQTGNGKSEHRHSRNQWTKMNCNWWI